MTPDLPDINAVVEHTALDGSVTHARYDPDTGDVILVNPGGGTAAVDWYTLLSVVDTVRDMHARAAAARRTLWEGDDVRLVADPDGGASFQVIDDAGAVTDEVPLAGEERLAAALALLGQDHQ